MVKRCGFLSAMCTVLMLFWALPVLAEMMVDTAWVRRYNGPSNIGDFAYAMALDDDGYVYVTGSSEWDYVTIKYRPDGETEWLRRYSGPLDRDDARALAVDGSGNVYVVGGSDNLDMLQYITIKYLPNGDTAWVRAYEVPDFCLEYSPDIALDGSGNVYMVGNSMDPGVTWEDYLTIKYDSEGDTAWVRTYNGPLDGEDCARALAVDLSGHVYVTGYTTVNGPQPHYGTVKYDSGGTEIWVETYGGPSNLLDVAMDVAVNDSANVYVHGYSSGSVTARDYATIKYHPDGDTAWVRRYNGPASHDDFGYAMALDVSGNICVTGYTLNSDTSSDYATVKYYPNGDTAWVRTYDASGHWFDLAYAIAVDNAGNVYVTGESWSSGTDYDYATIKYHPNGELVWVIRYNGLGNLRDWASSIAVDESGNVYVTGSSDGSGTYSDYVTIKYVQFLRGDVNSDGVIELADIVFLIDYLFRFGNPPDPLVVGDCNCDELVGTGDVVFLINYLLRDGPPPDCP